MRMAHVGRACCHCAGLLMLSTALAVPLRVARGQTPREPVYTYAQVDRPAQLRPGMRPPVFPKLLREAHVAGEVVVGFVVDTLGRVEAAPFYVYRSTHKLFTQAVRDCLPRLRFAPAVRSGRRVRQLVIGEFNFALDTVGGR